MSIQYVIEHMAIVVAAVSGSLAGRGKQIDLFGVVVLAEVSALGGGTLRDVILDARPVFWVADPSYFLTATIAAFFLFVVARFRKMPLKILLYADAGGLSLLTAVGVHKALVAGVSPIVAVPMGVMTGVAGGIIRDVLTSEIPIVFRHQSKLYATASLSGATVFVMLYSRVDGSTAWGLAIAVTLILRLAAIQWEIRLPLFLAK